MIKSLDDIRKRGKEYQRRFLEGCMMTEKVNAFVFHVKVISVKAVRISKGNHKDISTEDIILNSMWRNPIKEIREIFISDPNFMRNHLGEVFSFFYFPVSNPLGTEYKNEGFRYVLSFVRDKNGKPLSPSRIMEIQQHLSVLSDELVCPYGIYMRLNGFDFEGHMDIHFAFDRYMKSELSAKEFVKEILERNACTDMRGWLDDRILAEKPSEAEGYLFRYGNDVYQVIMKEPIRRNVPDNRLSFEFFIHDFCAFLWDDDGWREQMHSTNYVKNVCTLFLRYTDMYYNRDTFDSYGVKAEDLMSPSNGYYGGTCYDYIPNTKVREMCMNDPMMDSIFKVLLNGLRKTRKMSSEGMLILKEDNDRWNDCVRRIDALTGSPFGGG